MTELSPAAHAVLDAANGACMYRPDPEDTRRAVAAALRAAADQMSYAGADEAATWLAQIAAELEGQ